MEKEKEKEKEKEEQVGSPRGEGAGWRRGATRLTAQTPSVPSPCSCSPCRLQLARAGGRAGRGFRRAGMAPWRSRAEREAAAPAEKPTRALPLGLRRSRSARDPPRAPPPSSTRSAKKRGRSCPSSHYRGGPPHYSCPGCRGKRRKDDPRHARDHTCRLGASTSRAKPKRCRGKKRRKGDPRRARGRTCRLGASASRAKPKRCRGNPVEEGFAAFIGFASETREQHLRRHGGGLRSCARCNYYLQGPAWIATYGSCAAPSGPRRREVWLAERPAQLGGTWALGCKFCAAFEYKQWAGESDRDPSTRRRRGPWGAFEVRHRSLQASHIRAHECAWGHKIAESSFFRPDAPARIMLQATADDDRLLSGSVPQPQDWLRAWRMSRDPRSWQAAEHDDITSNFICKIRSMPVQRKGWKKLCVTMAEVLRDRKRKALKEATTISIAFDDKNSRKLLMFKCDTPGTPSRSCLDADPTLLPYGARLAMIGCMAPDLPGMSEYDDDYARRTAGQVVKLFAKLCCPGRGPLDGDLFLESVLQKVRFICVDGALLKTAAYLRQERMRSVILITRDPAHVIRTSTSKPLQNAEHFDEQYSRLFKGRHAVVKDFMYSHLWQDQLQACQKEILDNGERLGGDIKSVLRNMAFVAPRFESEATPRRRYVCLLRAIAHVLMVKAYDHRTKHAERKRYQDELKCMEKRSDAVMAGLSGDYGEACVEFLRVFDVDDPDIARMYPEKIGFTVFMQQMFQHGRVLSQSEDGEGENAHTKGNVGCRKTLTQIAFEQVQSEYTVRSGDHEHTLWRSSGGVQFIDECKAQLNSLGHAVDDLKDRLDAEFTHDDLQSAFVAFDLHAWHRAWKRREKRDVKTSMLDDRTLTLKELGAAFKKVFKALHPGFGEGEEEEGAKEQAEVLQQQWGTLVKEALLERRRMRTMPRRAPSERVRTAAWNTEDPDPMDNRIVWRVLLDDGTVPERFQPVVRAYLACLYSTGSVERGLGRDKLAVVEPHVGSSRPSPEIEEENSKCLELHREGPRREEDLFVRRDDEFDILLLNDFSRACASLWLETRGRRFGANSKARKDKGGAAVRERKHTDAALRRGVRERYAQIAREANTHHNAPSSLAADATQRTIFGETRRKLMLAARLTVGDDSKPSKGTKRYREDTEKKASEKSHAKDAEGVYAGWSAGRVIMRVGGAMAVTARDRNGARHAATARRWMQKNTVRAAKKQTVGTASRGQAPRRRSAAAAREPARPARKGERRRYRYSDPRQANPPPPPPPGPGRRRRIGVYRPRLRQEGACPDPRRRIGLAWIAVFRWRPSTAGGALRPSGPGNRPWRRCAAVCTSSP